MQDRELDLAKLYEIRGYEPLSSNDVQEVLQPYIEENILKPLSERHSLSSPAIREEAQTVSYTVGGFAYNEGHKAGWNDALSFMHHLAGAFINDDANVPEYDTIEESSNHQIQILKNY